MVRGAVIFPKGSGPCPALQPQRLPGSARAHAAPVSIFLLTGRLASDALPPPGPEPLGLLWALGAALATTFGLHAGRGVRVQELELGLWQKIPSSNTGLARPRDIKV